jgi:hypothetical protein
MESAWAQASEIAAAVREGRASASDVVTAALVRIGQRNPALNAFTAVLGERAVAKAAAIDKAPANARAALPLAGVPFAVKNLFDIAGLPTRAGSKINRDRAPATRDATLISRLEAAGSSADSASVAFDGGPFGRATPALDARHCGLGCSHAGCELCLGKTCLPARFRQRERELHVCPNALVFGTEPGVPHPTTAQCLERDSHYAILRARSSASRIKRSGVLRVFFRNASTMTPDVQ